VPDGTSPVQSILTNRLPYKAASLFFALALWLAAHSDEAVSLEIPVRLVAITESGESVAPEASVRVRALVVGRRRDVAKLLRSPPPVRHTVTRAAADSVIVTLAPADVDLPDGVFVRVREVRPHSLVLRRATYRQEARP